MDHVVEVKYTGPRRLGQTYNLNKINKMRRTDIELKTHVLDDCI